MAAMLGHLPSLWVDPETAGAVGHGKVLSLEVLGAVGEGPWAILHREHGTLLAVYEPHGPETAKPAVVIESA